MFVQNVRVNYKMVEIVISVLFAVGVGAKEVNND